MAAHLEGLPEELKLAIISCLETETRNNVKASTTCSSATGLDVKSYSPLKQLSLANGKWNALVRPVLFSRMVIKFSPIRSSAIDSRSPATRFRDTLKHGLRNFESFVKNGDVTHQPDSIMVSIDPDFAELGVALDNPAQHITDIVSMNKFWKRLFDFMDPLRLVIVAPISILGWLTTVEMQLTDAWAFEDMACQTLELSQDTGTRHNDILPTSSLTESAWDTELLFRIRPWTRLTLFEGSMLQSYGYYEYFNKQPPTILRAVATPRSASLTTFHHHVVFPFNTHVADQHLITLSFYKHIHLQYTPAKDDRVLDDPTMVGNRIDMGDCWREVEQIYRRAVSFDRPRLLGKRCRLQSFSSGDYEVESIRAILDEAFVLHARNGWVAVGPGSWVRPPPNPS